MEKRTLVKSIFAKGQKETLKPQLKQVPVSSIFSSSDFNQGNFFIF